jgi:hypothetical protein
MPPPPGEFPAATAAPDGAGCSFEDVSGRCGREPVDGLQCAKHASRTCRACGRYAIRACGEASEGGYWCPRPTCSEHDRCLKHAPEDDESMPEALRAPAGVWPALRDKEAHPHEGAVSKQRRRNGPLQSTLADQMSYWMKRHNGTRKQLDEIRRLALDVEREAQTSRVLDAVPSLSALVDLVVEVDVAHRSEDVELAERFRLAFGPPEN